MYTILSAANLLNCNLNILLASFLFTEEKLSTHALFVSPYISHFISLEPNTKDSVSSLACFWNDNTRACSCKTGARACSDFNVICKINWRSNFAGCQSVSHRLERWSIFCGNGMVMVLFSQRWNGNGFWKFLTITINGFRWDQSSATMVFDGFPILGDQWLTMVNEEKERILRQTQIHNKLLVNSKTIKSQTQYDSQILHCQFTQLTYPYYVLSLQS